METTLAQEKGSKTNGQIIQKKTAPFFSPMVFQRKLAIGSANDAYEVEADRVADQVVNMPSADIISNRNSGALLQRKCAGCEEEEILQKKPLAETITPLIQRSIVGSGGETQASDAVSTKISNSRGGGSLMENETRSFMENSFGTDFSDVRIHTDNNAKQLSSKLNAQAFTVGNNIYFNEGKYSPNSSTGKHLLAHELTHTVQQENRVMKRVQRLPEDDSYSLASEAREAFRLARARLDATNCATNPGGAHLPPMGTPHNLPPSMPLLSCSMTEADVLSSPEWCIDQFQNHRREKCYRKIPTGSGPFDQFCYSANGCCHNSPDTTSPVDPDSAGSGATCGISILGTAGHIWNDVF